MGHRIDRPARIPLRKLPPGDAGESAGVNSAGVNEALGSEPTGFPPGGARWPHAGPVGSGAEGGGAARLVLSACFLAR